MRLGADPDDTFEVIVRVLVPYLGESMARAALEVNRNKLGLHGPDLSRDGEKLLLDALSPGLRVFLGQDRTVRLLEEIRGTLAGRRP